MVGDAPDEGDVKKKDEPGHPDQQSEKTQVLCHVAFEVFGDPFGKVAEPHN